MKVNWKVLLLVVIFPLIFYFVLLSVLGAIKEFFQSIISLVIGVPDIYIHDLLSLIVSVFFVLFVGVLLGWRLRTSLFRSILFGVVIRFLIVIVLLTFFTVRESREDIREALDYLFSTTLIFALVTGVVDLMMTIGAVIGTKIETEVSILHKILFEHSENNRHWARIMIIFLAGVMGLVIGFLTLLPTVTTLYEQNVVYGDLIKLTNKASTISDPQQVTYTYFSYTNNLLGITFFMPQGWWYKTYEKLSIPQLANEGNQRLVELGTQNKKYFPDAVEQLGEAVIVISVKRIDPKVDLTTYINRETEKNRNKDIFLDGWRIGNLPAYKVTRIEKSNSTSGFLYSVFYIVKKDNFIFGFSGDSIVENESQFWQIDSLVNSVRFF